MRSTRVLLLTICFGWLAAAASAQELNPHSVEFDVSCDQDDDGTFESLFRVITFLNATGTAHDLGSNATLTTMSGIATGTLNGEIIFVSEIPERPGRGLRTVACEASATIVDEEGNVLFLEITDAQFLITPPGL